VSRPPLILASSSAYRRALLDRLRIPYTTVAPAIDESPVPDEAPDALALRLAKEKALKVASLHPDALIIGSDQVAVLNNMRLGKPGNYENARQQLMRMRGEATIFHTAICLLHAPTGSAWLKNIPTTVYFRNFTNAQAEHYLKSEQPYDCAGSAKVEGFGIVLIERIVSDDPTALIGLPLMALVTMLQQAGVDVV
jgi:7-methyl-GTP pyrophosphatase